MHLLLQLLFFRYPTSPQSSLSIGFGFSISFFSSSIALNWSSVSWNSKLLSNSFCHSVSLEKAYPFIFSLFAYSSIKSRATSLKFDFTFCFVFAHSLLPNLFIFGALSPTPIYFLMLSKLVVGIYRISSSLYFIFI